MFMDADGGTAVLGAACGVGKCDGGAVVCAADGALTCSTLTSASTETCDGLDNDCDGSTDEGVCTCGKLGVACPSGFQCESGNDPGEGWCVSADGGSVYVPAGEFWMGCNAAVDSDCQSGELPQHPVEVGSFEMDRTEVTAAAYKACGSCTAPATTGGSYGTYDPAGKQQHPINYVDWTQSKTYCESRGAGWRLCTEAEWEKGARGGCSLYCGAGDDACCKAAMPKYPWGNAEPACGNDLAWFNHCGGNTTQPVGTLPDGASPYGAYDLAGNVWEWVQDLWHDSYTGAPSTGYPAWETPSGSARVVRGGSFAFSAVYVRAGYRYHFSPGDAYYDLGFRCCRSSN